jgi:parallel beta-helix repeat protein
MSANDGDVEMTSVGPVDAGTENGVARFSKQAKQQERNQRRCVIGAAVLALVAVIAVIAAVAAGGGNDSLANGASGTSGDSDGVNSISTEAPTPLPTPSPTAVPTLFYHLLENGRLMADIVFAPDAPNMVALAANTLSLYLSKITNQTLNISNTPDSAYDFHIFVGRSEWTDSIGVTDEGTRDGGFKIASGPGFLVLLGNDTPFNASSYLNEAEWDAITAPRKFEVPDPGVLSYDSDLGIWEQDGKGSMNAVSHFLRELGVRWYHPRDWGTVYPTYSPDLSFASKNVTVNPDYPLRALTIYYKNFKQVANQYGGYEFGNTVEWRTWYMSLGSTYLQEYVTGKFPHGLHAVTARQETRENHPEYFAVLSGKRRDGLDGSEAKQNLCSEGLVLATASYAKHMFSTYKARLVSIWPSDGFTEVSQDSPECLAKATPERGFDGQISDYVWNFVNKVAWILHDDPDVGSEHMVVCGAYSAYKLIPLAIEDPRGMAPNIAVFFTFNRPGNYEALMTQWLDILPSKAGFRYDKYTLNQLGRQTADVPVVFPNIIARDIRFLAPGPGKVGGEFIEINTNWPAQGVEHDTFTAQSFNTWLTTRLYWDVSQDVGALLEEYYSRYYGPGGGDMRRLFEFSESLGITDFDRSISYTNPQSLVDMRAMAYEALAAVNETDPVYSTRINAFLELMNHRFVGAEIEIDSCRMLNSPSTTYKLNRDVVYNATGSTDGGACFFLNANGVTLDCQGHTIEFGGANGNAVLTESSKSAAGQFFVMKNCRLVGSAGVGPAVYLDNVADVIIDNVTIQTTGHGLSIDACYNATVSNNRVECGETCLKFSTRAPFSDCTIVGNFASGNSTGTGHTKGRGAYFTRSNGDVIQDNVFTGTEYGLAMVDSLNCVVENNFISGGRRSLFLTNTTKNMQLANNTIAT